MTISFHFPNQLESRRKKIIITSVLSYLNRLFLHNFSTIGTGDVILNFANRWQIRNLLMISL